MIKKYALYLLRWQLSTPILAGVLWLLAGVPVIWATVIANLIGGLVFFWVDQWIFRNGEKGQGGSGRKMELVEKKRCLRQYRLAANKINRIQDEILQCRELATRITPVISDAPGTHGSDKLQAAVEKIVMLEERLEQEVDQLVLEREKIVRAIRGIENQTQQEVLERRYLNGERWEAIAVNMHLDYRWVLRLHKKALLSLSFS